MTSGVLLGAMALKLSGTSLEVGTCAETTTKKETSSAEVRALACRTLGRPASCPAHAVEWLEASGYVRRLWLLPLSTADGRIAWAERPPRSPTSGAQKANLAEGTEALGPEPGQEVGEDALVGADPRWVPCGPLRPRWVDESPKVAWWDAVLVVYTRINIKKEIEEKRERALAFARAEELALSSKEIRARNRASLSLRHPGDEGWIKPNGEPTFFTKEPDAEHEAALRKYGWRKGNEPEREELPAHVEAMLARNPLLERILKLRGREAPQVEPVARYRMEGHTHRYVLVRTDYTSALNRLKEPTRSRVWAALHAWPGGIVETGQTPKTK